MFLSLFKYVGIQKSNLQKYINTIYRNTQIKITKNTEIQDTETQITEILKGKLQK